MPETSNMDFAEVENLKWLAPFNRSKEILPTDPSEQIRWGIIRISINSINV